MSCMPYVYPVSFSREPCDRIQPHRELVSVNSGEQCTPVFSSFKIYPGDTEMEGCLLLDFGGIKNVLGFLLL